MSDVLKHFGIKGMKWGVIRKRESSSGSKGKSQNGNKTVKRLKEEVGSIKREHSWKKVAGDISKMSTKDINKLSSRIQMENELKRLAKSKGDKQNYRLRGKMSDQELSRKVIRLRAQDNLRRNMSETTKAHSEFGKTLIKIAGPLVVQKTTGIKISPYDVENMMKNEKVNVNAELTKAADSYYKRKRK